MTAKGGSAGKPDYFEVKRKDGSVSTYGAANDDNSEHKVYPLTGNTASDNVLTWALQQVKDSAGNKIRYHYTRNEDGHRINKISYAYGSTNTPRAEVRFSYEARTDDTLGYLGGYKLQSTQRLTRITVHGATTSGGLSALRNYRLGYESATTQASNVLSRLTGVKECAGSGSSVCLPETRFTWSAPAPLFKGAAAATLALNTDDWTPADFTPADINGDGVTDLVWTEGKDTGHRIRYALADKANGALVREDFTGSVSELEYEDNYENAILRVHTEAVDYNADGRMDIIVYSKMTGLTKVHLAKPRPVVDGNWTAPASILSSSAVTAMRTSTRTACWTPTSWSPWTGKHPDADGLQPAGADGIQPGGALPQAGLGPGGNVGPLLRLRRGGHPAPAVYPTAGRPPATRRGDAAVLAMETL